MEDFKKSLTDYILSGHALLHVDTFEKDRAIQEIAEVAEKTRRTVYLWSIASGWLNGKGLTPDEVKIKRAAPVDEHVRAIIEFPNDTICILKDFGTYLEHKTFPTYDVVISCLDQIRQIISSVGQTIIFVGPVFNTPKELLHDITHIDFGLPDDNKIGERINFACAAVVTKDGSEFKADKKIIPKMVEACRGMTSQQVVDRAALVLRKHKGFNEEAVVTIVREKAGIIRSSGLLTYIEPPKGGLANVGGYDALKKHVLLDQPCFTKKAREFGIEFPKGIMLVGIPGCGKTLLSLAIASELGLPLISMDVGNLMDKFVGESENNMREAIKMLESIAPCVLVLDEIEKGFGGSGDMDGGASRRVFGTFIKWLNDRQSPIYIVATANQVQSLPAEFCRKGRFDEIYGLALPEELERKEIFNIHLSKRGRNTKDFNVIDLAASSQGYTGSDIEQVIKLSLKIAFAKDEKLTTNHLKKAIPEIIPLSKSEGGRIEEITKWCSLHAKPANPQNKNFPPKILNKSRKVVIEQ